MDRLIEQKISEGYAFNPVAAIQKGFATFAKNLPLFLAITVISFLINFLAEKIGLGLGLLAYFLVTPLIAGFTAIAADKTLREEKAGFEDYKLTVPFAGNLILTHFIQVLATLGIGLVATIILSLLTSFIIIGSREMVGFASIFMVLGLLFTMIITAIWFIFNTNYVIFAKAEAARALGLSRRIVTKQLGKFILFGLIMALFFFAIMGYNLYNVGLFDIGAELFKAAIEKDNEALMALTQEIETKSQNPKNYVFSFLTTALTVVFYCSAQAAFREVHDLDNETKGDTISHLVD